MKDAFDEGFTETRKWLNNDSKGPRPQPDAATDDVYRIDWWRGSDKAFEFCAELDKQEDVKVAMIEDFILMCIYGAGCVLGAYWISLFSIPAVLFGLPLFVYCLKKVLRK